MVNQISNDIERGAKIAGHKPRVLIIGALGRCGRGAVDACLKAGCETEEVLKWDMAETAKGGPFVEIVESDMYVSSPFQRAMTCTDLMVVSSTASISLRKFPPLSTWRRCRPQTASCLSSAM